MQHTTGSFTGRGGVPIFTQQWLPDDPPRAVILLVHGIAEHSGRYEHVARALVGHGWAVYALDHRGHGRSGGDRGAVTPLDDYVQDLEQYVEQVRAAQPGVPLFVYGHSLGSLISLLFAFRHQGEVAGLITTGTVLKLVGANPPLVALVKGLNRVVPNLKVLPLAPTGISRDPAVVQAYIDDPLVQKGRLRIGVVAEIQKGSERCAALLPTLHLPYLALHGGADPICLPEGVEIVRQQCAAGDASIKVYDGLYHEIHNEPEQDAVLADIADWLDAHLAQA